LAARPRGAGERRDRMSQDSMVHAYEVLHDHLGARWTGTEAHGRAEPRTVPRDELGDDARRAAALIDPSGNLAADHDRVVSAAVAGGGILAGLGTGRPRTDEPFGTAGCMTYDGRALAIIRPTGAGDITITVTAEGRAPVTLQVTAQREDEAIVCDHARRSASLLLVTPAW
jgi:Glycoside hydrolase family 2 C-terminal domain 5